jgi:hypothetical protein
LKQGRKFLKIIKREKIRGEEVKGKEKGCLKSVRKIRKEDVLGAHVVADTSEVTRSVADRDKFRADNILTYEW